MCVRVCMCVCVCVCARARACLCTYLCKCTCACKKDGLNASCVYPKRFQRMRVHAGTRVCARQMFASMQLCYYVCMHACTRVTSRARACDACARAHARRTGHIAHMELILERCERMAASGAYLHWFRKYGFEDQELHLALEDLRCA